MSSPIIRITFNKDGSYSYVSISRTKPVYVDEKLESIDLEKMVFETGDLEKDWLNAIGSLNSSGSSILFSSSVDDAVANLPNRKCKYRTEHIENFPVFRKMTDEEYEKYASEMSNKLESLENVSKNLAESRSERLAGNIESAINKEKSAEVEMFEEHSDMLDFILSEWENEIYAKHPNETQAYEFYKDWLKERI